MIRRRTAWSSTSASRTTGRTRESRRVKHVRTSCLRLAWPWAVTRKKLVMVQVGKVKAFSEVGVRHTVRLTDDIESRNDLASRLEKVCEIDRGGRGGVKSSALRLK